jgi:DNA-binding CsgD family transcriptional regulator
MVRYATHLDAPTGRSGVVGRDDELAACAELIGRLGYGPSEALVLLGEPGIGKTTIWETALDEGRKAAQRVLVCRPAASEAALTYVGLVDLLGSELEDVLPELPAPQRTALQVAILREETGTPLRPHAVSAGVLSALALLSEAAPTLVAIDDVQWLDRSSADALAYASRRLKDRPVSFLLSARDAPTSRLVGELPPDRTRTVRVGPLTAAGIHHLVRSRFDRTLSRPVLIRLTEASGGNPLFAAELARMLEAGETRLRPGEPLGIPESLQDLLGGRFETLRESTRRTLLGAAALGQPTAAVLGRFAGSTDAATVAIEEAEAAGIAELHDGRVRFRHPLFASTLYAAAGGATRARLHLELAELAEGAEERARHLALGTLAPDEAVASVLEETAFEARARGAPQAALDLAELADNLTPPELGNDIVRRRMQTAVYCFEAGDIGRARSLLEEVAAQLPPGPQRAAAVLRLACVRHYDHDRVGVVELLDEALAEAAGDEELQAWIHAVLARLHAWSSDVGGGLRHARRALELAGGSDDGALLLLALTAVAMCEIFAGNGLREELLERALTLESAGGSTTPVLVEWHPWINFSSLLIYAEQFDTARARLEDMHRRALETGDDGSLPELLFWLADLECRAGRYELALRYAHQGDEIADQVGQQLMVSQLASARALALAHLGRVDEAAALAEVGLAKADALGSAPPRTRNLAALGFVRLSAGDFAGAAAALSDALEVARSTGYREPGQFIFLGNLVEALVATGSLAEAEELIAELEDSGRALDRAWALGAAARGRALVAAAAGSLDEAAEHAEEALRQHRRLAMPFETARTLLLRGSIERRAKRKRSARAALDEALAGFESIGAAGWVEQVRTELGRIGGRPSSSDELTATERRVADLVVEGRSNKEVAAALFVSVHTVEAHLSRIYRKLGVHTRGELQHRLGGGKM